MKFKNKKILVYGLGSSGRAAIKILTNLGAKVSFFDDDPKFMEYIGFEKHPEKQNFDLVVISPGVKCLGNHLLEDFSARKIVVISELDLGYLLCKGKIVAVTGTNGKTTTCMLVNKILKTAGYETFLCGNIGLPFSMICQRADKKSVVVCEVSSFQLEASKFFRANVACILNVRPDHLDRHESFENYVQAKSKIAQNLRRGDALILNLDDEVAKTLVLHKKYQFFSKNKLKKGVYAFQNQIFVNGKSITSLNSIPLKGKKNLENVLAAVSICSHFHVSENAFENAISSFTPADHRMKIVGQVNGVTYVDDSKATNVASTVACVEAFSDKEIWLLMGGLGKEIDYAELFKEKFNIKQVVCFGADREKIAACAQKFAYPVAIFEKFDKAVLFCKRMASADDFVLLSPACASFDEFSSYAERGERFENLILGQNDG